MTSVARFLLSLIGFAGVSTAVGVPVTLKVQSRKTRSIEPIENTPLGGGNSQVSIDKCVDPKGSGWSDIYFGTTQEGEVCWTTESDQSLKDDSDKYTDFFSSQGRDKNKNWNGNSSTDNGTQQCLDQSHPWVVLGTHSGFQYLGLCDGSEIANTKFVKKGKTGRNETHGDEGTISVCDSRCGETEVGTIGSSTEALTEEQAHNGKTVKFLFKGTINKG